MHLLVLSAFRLAVRVVEKNGSRGVSMHLLVLSAFRHRYSDRVKVYFLGLNAPSGAQCFPTPLQ